MRTLRICLPEPLHAELKQLAKLYDVSMSEMLRSGAAVMLDRYYRYKEPDKSRPDIDKVLNQEQTNSHG